MSSLDQLIHTPRLLEMSGVDLDAPLDTVWEHLRTENLADSLIVRLLFGLRTLPARLGGKPDQDVRLRVDDFRSSPEHPGFQLLAETPRRSLTVGAIGQVWQLDIPFRHVSSAEHYATFAEPGWVKVAWEVRLAPRGQDGTHLDFEVRVDATDDESWRRFTHYWKLIGPGSHFVRHVLLRGLERRFGALGSHEEERTLPGDELLPDARAQSSQAITIEATPDAIWPWLLQMGTGRGGFYAIDALDNGGHPSARELHPDLTEIRVGQILPATPKGSEGFEVLSLDPERALVLGSLYDPTQRRQLPFAAARPGEFWQVTWAFTLEPLDPTTTRLHARARAAFSPSERLHLSWIRPVHALMQASQLRHLAERAEGRLPRDTLRDVQEGLGGAAIMVLAAMSPFFRTARRHWGLSDAEANGPRPGDDLVPAPSWSWTHAVEVSATPQEVWPWVAQLGADRAGFYSYQWLENLAGCKLRNAQTIHPEWAHHVGDPLILHPAMPPIPVVSVEPGRALVAFAPPDEAARKAGRPWAAASWAFLVEPLEAGRCRIISRFRTAHSSDLLSRLTQGPALLEPIAFAMDRRMLLGIKQRVDEQTRRRPTQAAAPMA